MNFFELQDRARKNTTRLIVLMVLAVLAVILLIYPAVCIGLFMVGFKPSTDDSGFRWEHFWHPQVMLIVVVFITLIVGGGMVMKMVELAAGGKVIAESLGGRRIDPASTNPTDRRIHNVVEEMAIASGVPVPPIYIMDNEDGINAFAAGYNPDDAVIGVTRGCVELLSRDELQGVMAHEFSHILNGDMRMNIRLISIVHGILIISLIGSMLVRIGFYSSATSRRSKDNNGMIPILVVGFLLLVIGSVGMFFGNLIKAAVSRQREYLADAAAVQFTRNPSGIGGALVKIGGFKRRSKLRSPKAQEASHMYFAEGVSHMLGSMMATHPGLPKRIQRVLPDWDGVFPNVESSQWHQEQEQERQRRAEEARKSRRLSAVAAVTAGAAMSITQQKRAMQQAGIPMNRPASKAVDGIGQPTPEHVVYAQKLRESIPDVLQEAAHEPYGARAVVYTLLLSNEAEAQTKQIQQLQQNGDPEMDKLVLRLMPLVQSLPDETRLPVLDMALPSLKELTDQHYAVFKQNVEALIHADKRVSLFEWTLHTVVFRRLASTFEKQKRIAVQYYSLRGVIDELNVLLSTLAMSSTDDPKEARVAFEAGAAQLATIGLKMLPANVCGLNVLAPALEKLDTVALREKRRIIFACAACIASNKKVSVREGELLRAVADYLGCPMPPLLPGQTL